MACLRRLAQFCNDFVPKSWLYFVFLRRSCRADLAKMNKTPCPRV
jgi:hypothetical protein